MSGYNPVMPQMAGMGDTAMNAAVAGGATGGQQQGAEMGNFSSTSTGNIFNTKTGAVQSPGFFGQGGMAQIGLGAISTLGSLWNSFQQNKIAKKSLALQKRTFETNLKNQTQTYNTELTDRIENRYRSEGRENYQEQADSYVEENQL